MPIVVDWRDEGMLGAGPAALVHKVAKVCNPTAQTDDRGLLLGTELRLADTHALAFCNLRTVLDVTVGSTQSAKAGTYCTNTALS